jgi:hypothetical protein
MNQVTRTLLLLPPQFIKPDVLTTLPLKPEPAMNLSKFDEYTRKYVLKYKDKLFPKKPDRSVFDESVPTDLLLILDSNEFKNLSVDELYEFLESVTDYCQRCLLETLVRTFDFISGMMPPYDDEPYVTLFDVLNPKYDPLSFDYEYISGEKRWQTL